MLAKIVRAVRYQSQEIILGNVAVLNWERRLATTTSTTLPRFGHYATSNEATSSDVVMPTAGMGNNGDQAMLESFLDASVGRVVVIFERRNQLCIPDRHRQRTEVEVIRGLTSGGELAWFYALLRFRGILRNADSFTVIGADIMDGGYSRRESVRRMLLLEEAARSGVKSALVGFSWNRDADSLCESRLREISTRCMVVPRDPLSGSRLHQSGVSISAQGADLVFGLSTEEAQSSELAWIRDAQGVPVFLVNVSGLIRRHNDQTALYVDLIGGLLNAGIRVLVLPHVFRNGDDDLAACLEVGEHFAGNPSVMVSRSPLSPTQVSTLCRRAVAVVTGRMHLAVIALSNGVPSAVFATRGKVEGLVELFGDGVVSVDINDPDAVSRIREFSVSAIQSEDAKISDSRLIA
jgi:Uncharacterized conserved protein